MPSLVIVVSAVLVFSCAQINRITELQTDAADRYTHATAVGVSNECVWNVTQSREIRARQWSATSAHSASPAPTYSRAPVIVLPPTTHNVVPTIQFAVMTCVIIATFVIWEQLRVNVNNKLLSSFTANVVCLITYLLTYLLTYLPFKANHLYYFVMP